jgi:hypothetical protein
MKKVNIKKMIILLSFLVGVHSASGTNKDSLPTLETKIKTIAIFKNGLGFFIREGRVLPQNGWAITKWVPNSALGSLWISSLNKNTQIEEVIALKEEIKSENESSSLEELLKANIDKKVLITFGDKLIEGTVKSVLERPAESTKIALIESRDGITAINLYSISKIDFPKNISTKSPIKEKAKRFKFKMSNPSDEAALNISYLQKGITWVPGYLIDIKDPAKAVFTMQAVLVNDIEDLENVEAFFVVGYPNFTYSNTLSPMALEENITQFISSLSTGGRRASDYNMSNIVRQSVVSYDEYNRTESEMDYPTEIKGLSGEAEEDLFLYQKKEVSLRKGERAYYPIFSAKVDYKHLYEWDIPATMTTDPKTKEQVWHSIKINNSTNYPWTTAPAFVVSELKPIAQNNIDYTPKGSKANLKLTIATDVKTDRKESEIERKRNVELYNHNYDLVTVKGDIYVKNYKNKDITMEIKKNLTGEVLEVSHDGKTKKIAEGLKGVNFNSIISWEIPVKAGEELNITYKYKVYQGN